MLRPYPGLKDVLRRGKAQLNINTCTCSWCKSGIATHKQALSAMMLWACLGLACVLMLIGPCNQAAHAQEIDITRIAIIESHNNPNAYNKHSHAVGICQITEPVLIEYNKHFFTNWTLLDLYNMDLNMMISEWYLNDRIPELLRHYKIADTVDSRLIAYNFGIRGLVKHRHLPTETKKYLIMYHKLNKEK